MSAENKALVRYMIDEVWNKRNVAAAEQILAPNFVGHYPATPGDITGMEGFTRFFNQYTSAFPDQHFSIEDLFAEGDRVVTRWTVEATHKGALPGIAAPTGRRVRVSGTTISRIENGKIAEDYVQWDALGMMQQLGVMQRSTGA
jgi:steroid delta-isomerase-like uncharacterized protein